MNQFQTASEDFLHIITCSICWYWEKKLKAVGCFQSLCQWSLMSGFVCFSFYLFAKSFFFLLQSVNMAQPTCVYVTMRVCCLPIAASLISCRLYWFHSPLSWSIHRMSQSFTGTTAIQTPFLKEAIMKTLCFVCSCCTLTTGATLAIFFYCQ